MKRVRKEIVGIAILLASGVAIFFASCEGDDLGSGKKGGIAVNFTVGNVSYGENEVVTRSGRELESETVVVPVEGDIYMYATLEEDAGEELRAGEPVALTQGTLMQIMAYDEEDNHVGTANYKATAVKGGIEPVGAGLSVPSAGTYTFVAFSYNSTTEAPSSYIMSGTDPLCGATTQTIDESDYDVSIIMKHLFSKVTVEVTTVGLSGASSITDVIDAAVQCYSLSMNNATYLSGGQILPAYVGYSFDLTLSWPDPFVPDATVTSDPCVVYGGGKSTTSVKINSVEIDGVVYSGTATFNMKLLQGKSYTLEVSFKKVVWAGSNIYWDAVNQKLTFDGVGVTTHQMHQGVFFKWGSLVGISPAGAYWDGFDNSTKVYAPKYDSGTSSWGWENPNTFAFSDWNDIPYMDDVVNPPVGFWPRSNTYLMDDERNTDDGYAYWKDKKGDICRFISENGYGPNDGNTYRMPSSYEFVRETGGYSYDNSDGWTRVGGSGWSTSYSDSETIPSEHADGTFTITYGASNSGIVFPASGFRGNYYDDGILRGANVQGTYWSGSVHDNLTIAYCVAFSQLYAATLDVNDLRYARPVRCVKN
jgi:hypothetical protein